MSSRPVSVKTISSYAHRSDGSLRVMLGLSASDAPAAQGSVLRLSRGRRSVEVAAASTTVGDDVRIEASLPDVGLSEGIWQLALQARPDAPFHRLQARLLVSTKQPVALLTGAPPRTRLRPPTRRPVERRWGETVARRVVGGALRRLPEDRAARYRSTLRRAAGRVTR